MRDPRFAELDALIAQEPPEAMPHWWTCFVCGKETGCVHREPAIRYWMLCYATKALVDASRPEAYAPLLPARRPAARETEPRRQPGELERLDRRRSG